MPPAGVPKAEALALRLEDVAAVRESIECGSGELFVAERLGPLEDAPPVLDEGVAADAGAPPTVGAYPTNLIICPSKPVGATRDVRSLTRQRLRKTPEKPTGLCPYPFPFQIWFDGDAVRQRSASRRKRGGS